MRPLALLAVAAALALPAAAEQKVLRYAFEIAETSFDPQRVSDVYSNVLGDAIFDTPYTYDYLASICPCEACTAERGGPPVPFDPIVTG